MNTDLVVDCSNIFSDFDQCVEPILNLCKDAPALIPKYCNNHKWVEISSNSVKSSGLCIIESVVIESPSFPTINIISSVPNRFEGLLWNVKHPSSRTFKEISLDPELLKEESCRIYVNLTQSWTESQTTLTIRSRSEAKKTFLEKSFLTADKIKQIEFKIFYDFDSNCEIQFFIDLEETKKRNVRFASEIDSAVYEPKVDNIYFDSTRQINLARQSQVDALPFKRGNFSSEVNNASELDSANFYFSPSYELISSEMAEKEMVEKIVSGGFSNQVQLSTQFRGETHFSKSDISIEGYLERSEWNVEWIAIETTIPNFPKVRSLSDPSDFQISQGKLIYHVQTLEEVYKCSGIVCSEIFFDSEELKKESFQLVVDLSEVRQNDVISHKILVEKKFTSVELKENTKYEILITTQKTDSLIPHKFLAELVECN